MLDSPDVRGVCVGAGAGDVTELAAQRAAARAAAGRRRAPRRRQLHGRLLLLVLLPLQVLLVRLPMHKNNYLHYILTQISRPPCIRVGDSDR